MELDRLHALEQDYKTFITLFLSVKRARNQREKKDFESELYDLRERMIKQYSLKNYVPLIKSTGDHNYFDFDVQECITKINNEIR